MLRTYDLVLRTDWAKVLEDLSPAVRVATSPVLERVATSPVLVRAMASTVGLLEEPYPVTVQALLRGPDKGPR